MRHSNSHRRQGTGSCLSSSLALNPYFIEDIAMTPGELERVRAVHTRVVVPR
jgi:hypothetical protein